MNYGNSSMQLQQPLGRTVIDSFRLTDQLLLVVSLTSFLPAPHLSVARTKLDSNAE